MNELLFKVGVTLAIPSVVVGLLNSISLQVEWVAVAAFVTVAAGLACMVSALVVRVWTD